MRDPVVTRRQRAQTLWPHSKMVAPEHLLCAAVLVLGLFLLVSLSTRERYGNVLGAAGKYQTQYVNCVRRCETSDPRLRLSQNPWQCGWACDHLVTDALAGGRQEAAFIDAIPSVVDSCDAWCARVAPGPGNGRCRDECVCVQRGAIRCGQDCRFAPRGEEASCRAACMATKAGVDCYAAVPEAWR